MKNIIKIHFNGNELIRIKADSFMQDDDYLILIKHVFLIRKIKVAKILKNQIELVRENNIFMKEVNASNIIQIPIYANGSNHNGF